MPLPLSSAMSNDKRVENALHILLSCQVTMKLNRLVQQSREFHIGSKSSPLSLMLQASERQKVQNNWVNLIPELSSCSTRISLLSVLLFYRENGDQIITFVLTYSKQCSESCTISETQITSHMASPFSLLLLFQFILRRFIKYILN